MKREVHPSSGFTRAMRRWLKKHPEMDPIIAALLESLTEDAFDASLGTHKLKGK